MVVGNVHGRGDGRHRSHQRGRRRTQQQGADEFPAFAVGATDGRGQLHVRGQERGGLQEPTAPGDRDARHERARGAGAGRDRVRPDGIVHVHHIERRRKREYHLEYMRARNGNVSEISGYTWPRICTNQFPAPFRRTVGVNENLPPLVTTDDANVPPEYERQRLEESRRLFLFVFEIRFFAVSRCGAFSKPKPGAVSISLPRFSLEKSRKRIAVENGKNRRNFTRIIMKRSSDDVRSLVNIRRGLPCVWLTKTRSRFLFVDDNCETR